MNDDGTVFGENSGANTEEVMQSFTVISNSIIQRAANAAHTVAWASTWLATEAKEIAFVFDEVEIKMSWSVRAACRPRILIYPGEIWFI